MAAEPSRRASPKNRPRSRNAPRRKLTNKEQRELDGLPARIETLEQEQAALGAKLADPGFYKGEPSAPAAAKSRLEACEREHAAAFARWEQLEGMRAKP